MHLSVLATLKEALRLWKQHAGFLTLVALFLQFPGSLGAVIPSALWAIPMLKTTAIVVLSVIFQTAATAAVLTLLHRKPVENRWIVAARGAYAYTGRLVGVYIGLCLIGFVAFIPLGLVLFRVGVFVAIFITAVFVLFLKFALANPLVVAEGQEAWAALKGSWRMTRNRFWFVVGCYLIFGVVEWGIDYAAVHLPFPVWLRGSAIRFGKNVIDTYWIVLPWAMYVQIRQADEAASVVSEAVIY